MSSQVHSEPQNVPEKLSKDQIERFNALLDRKDEEIVNLRVKLKESETQKSKKDLDSVKRYAKRHGLDLVKLDNSSFSSVQVPKVEESTPRSTMIESKEPLEPPKPFEGEAKEVNKPRHSAMPDGWKPRFCLGCGSKEGKPVKDESVKDEARCKTCHFPYGSEDTAKGAKWCPWCGGTEYYKVKTNA